MLLSNINYIIKDISYLRLYKVKYKSINNKLVFNLDLLVLKSRRDTIDKWIRVFKLNNSRLIRRTKGASLRG
jgi:hypothetical protein